MTSAPNGGRRNGLVGTILDRVLGYASTPWKAIFILVLVLICGIGFAVWTERAALLRVWSHPEPTVMRSDIAPVILNILNKTTAEAASAWSVNLATDIAQLLIARKRGGDTWILQPTILAAIHEQTHRVFLTQIIRGQPICADPHEFEGPLGQFLVNDGWNWACMVPEPPSSQELLIGAILMVWQHNPSKAYSDQAVDVVRSMTDQIIQR